MVVFTEGKASQTWQGVSKMMFSSGVLVMAACMPCMVWADSVAVATAVAVASSGPDYVTGCNCHLSYEPVCGTDGNTYSNVCVLGCFNEENESNGRPIIKIYSKGECETVTCYCPSTYEPICATNNQTYPNKCYLNCENSVRISNGLDPFENSYDAACQIPFCVCPDLVIPVCGTDGKTYKNICMLQCYSRINQSQRQLPVYLQEVGACKNETCDCPKQKDELCASDDKTYYNNCVLTCENRRRTQLKQELLTVQNRGKCVYCQACTADYNPVCASNDVTFSNYCHFLCENKKREAANKPLLRKRWYGECDCSCSKEWCPVCATNNRTFQNRCALHCLNRKRKQDGLLEYGIQYDGICYNCDCGGCGDRYVPVCGSDNNTYLNKCWLECISDCRVYSGYSSICKKYNGKCKV